MDRTTKHVLLRMSFNRFCPTATKNVTVGQIKFYGGPGAGLSAELWCRTWCRTKNFEILKFDNLKVFKVFGDMNGVGVKYD